MSKQGPNSHANFFTEPQHYPSDGYVFAANVFNQEQAIQYFVDWLMDSWQWIPRDNRKYVYYEVRKHITDGFVKWHGGIDDDGQMRNAWWLYHEWKGNQKGFKHVWVVNFQKHYIEHGHHFEPIVSSWGMPSGGNRDCVVCGRLKLCGLEGAHAEIINIDELIMFDGSQIKQVNKRKAELEEKIGYYDSYK